MFSADEKTLSLAGSAENENDETIRRAK